MASARIYYNYIIGILFINFTMTTQIKGQDDFILNALKSQPENFEKFYSNPEKFRLQIIYTQINRDKRNHPHFKKFTYRTDLKEYFYPASTVKFPATIIALEKLKELNIPRKAEIKIHQNRDWQTSVGHDSSSENGKASIENYIKKILLVSDNDAFNRLYEFIGQETFNQRLKEWGMQESFIRHRLQVPLGMEENKITNPLSFYDPKGKEIYFQEEQISQFNFPKKTIFLGKGYMNQKDSLIHQPFDFSDKNSFALEDQQILLKKLLFPESFPKKDRLNLRKEDLAFLYQYLSEYPEESTSPHYRKEKYFPTYCKFLYYGSFPDDQIDPNIRIFNKVGAAYGFLTDNMYLVDFENKVEFLLSATIMVNEDAIFNNNHYEYDEEGYPFFRDLGKLFYEIEKNRSKENLPNLKKWKLAYD